MLKLKRIIILILDSLGVGELPDAAEYGDVGSNTLANTAAHVGGLELPNLSKLGLGNIIPVLGVPAQIDCQANFGKMAEASIGKDSTTGHWEMMGLISTKSFPVYPDGFPPELIDKFIRLTGRGVLGNKAASGTVIIDELGEEQRRTGNWIVYTSADSVFQVAANTDYIPLDELYDACRIAREDILVGEHAVGRVIARPYVSSPGSYWRTPKRRDFSLPPTGDTALDFIKKDGREVYAIGKVHELFAGRGITGYEHSESNADGLEKTVQRMQAQSRGLIITNLVDFDMRWGHRNDAVAYAAGLKEVDAFLPNLIDLTGDEDALMITADHGCDPTTVSTDHSREYVPLLVYGPSLNKGHDLGTRKTFADLGLTICELLNVEAEIAGESFAGLL